MYKFLKNKINSNFLKYELTFSNLKFTWEITEYRAINFDLTVSKHNRLLKNVCYRPRDYEFIFYKPFLWNHLCSRHKISNILKIK